SPCTWPTPASGNTRAIRWSSTAGTPSSDSGGDRRTLGAVGAFACAGADPAHGEVAALALDAEDLTVADEDLAAVAGAVDAHHDLAPSLLADLRGERGCAAEWVRR